MTPPQKSPALGALGVLAASALSVPFIGWSSSSVLKALQVLGLILAAVLGAFWVLSVVAGRMANYQEITSDEEHDRIEDRVEFLATHGLAAEPEEGEFLVRDPFDDKEFDELVREALDDLPDLLRHALEGNVAVVISDNGHKYGAYGLYQGSGATGNETNSKIVIFRDTLRRDFGRHPQLLQEQVTRTVRHELAHHVGFDELGVRELGL